MLKVTGYEIPGNTLILTWFAIGLLICGDSNRAAQSDVCIIHLSMTILLLLQEDKTTHNCNEPEPQMMAKAITAYQHNNSIRCNQDIPELNNITFPCLTMVRSQPCFYKVTVTKQLSDAITQGSYPSQVTVIKHCVPPSLPYLNAKVMEDVDYCRVALRYYTTFLLKWNIVRCYSDLKPNIPTRNCIGSLCSQDLCK